ncbi:MAG: hypothetical protein H6Q73_3126 [Firmicutes bacterium]|nr:hypothetical protein [Bacillota bacterium]
MELFSEIHSRYFYIITEILKAAAVRKLTAQDVASIVARLGFAETSFVLAPPLLNANQDSYCLLKADASGYVPVPENVPPLTLTALQKRWLKAILNDQRFAMFTDETEYAILNSLLADIEPLYNNKHLVSVDMANDGDVYTSPEYKSLFRTTLQAIQLGKVLLITYESSKGNRLSAYFAPYKLEFSMKDDKFRLVAVRMRHQQLRSLYKLNLSRITSLTIMEWNTPLGLDAYIHTLRMPQPVEIEITNERNGFERIFTQLSNFERISEYNETTGTCIMKIYYYEVDEMELLITLLSFGPIIRVLGPASFRQQLVERITNQIQRFATNPSNI